MILQDKVLVPLGPKNIRYFKELGYEIPIGKDNRGRLRVEKEKGLLVKLCDIPISSPVRVKVKCEDCNQEREVEYGSLANRVNSSYTKTGETLCSLCANRRMTGENSGAYKHGNILYPQYRSNARRRNIPFNLTIEQFENLVPSSCFYCNEESNGIDRWDSNIGYEISNCVSCCAECNFLKNNKKPEDFLNKIRKIYNNLNLKNESKI